ncbi:MAG: hypothetical protein KDB27_13560 [Planctomycetales bacterium]|nr:hypothetical protein [Planctomycetales bacterium]
MNNVVTSSIVFEPTGVKEYDGGYDDWLRQRATDDPQPKNAGCKPKSPQSKDASPKSPAANKPRRLSYKEMKELEALPSRLEELETQIARLHQAMADADFYKRSGDDIAAAQKQLTDLENELSSAFERWEELEAIESAS